jgi:hypothetical protein
MVVIVKFMVEVIPWLLAAQSSRNLLADPAEMIWPSQQTD